MLIIFVIIFSIILIFFFLGYIQYSRQLINRTRSDENNLSNQIGFTVDSDNNRQLCIISYDLAIENSTLIEKNKETEELLTYEQFINRII
jgi:hypothetical protein